MSTVKRKLIEVALPLEAINRESAREKSIRHGHPSTLHLWWARRPLAATRAVLFAQLVDDPSARPEEFPTEAAQSTERKRLFDLLERLVVWENINDEELYREAYREILKSTDGHPPAILDPFAGGGSIPLEAQRLGLEARASDLNPVAVLINKALIEIPPKWHGQAPVFPGAVDARLGAWSGATGLAEDVRRYGGWMRDQAVQRIGHLYPKANLADGSRANVVAWIWARTVSCPNPACGITMPLVRSFWLSKKKDRPTWVVPIVDSERVTFRVQVGGAGPDTEGTVGRSGATCVACDSPVALKYVRDQGRSGRLGATLMAIVAEGDRQRVYLPADPSHVEAALVQAPANVPDSDLPDKALGFRVQAYGMTQHKDLFTNRQLVALTTLSDLVREARELVLADALAAGLEDDPRRLQDGGTGAGAYADSVAVYLAFGVSKVSNLGSSLVGWMSDRGALRETFARQAISMVWDFAEPAPLGDSGGSWATCIEKVALAVASCPANRMAGSVVQQDAARVMPFRSVVSTDPPYYDNVGYADLSDYFYVWLRRSIGDIFPAILGTMLTPKADELVADPFRRGGPERAERFFEDGFRSVFAGIRGETYGEAPIAVFYAFKQSDTDAAGTASTGWQTLLEGMLQSGWEVTATWPVRTEGSGRLRALGSNALASSVVLACRPRPTDAVVTNRRAFITSLKTELPRALRELQQGSIAPVDLAQAAIGPGMAVFSRHVKVVEADGSDMTVRTALALINQVLDEVLSEQEGDFDADTRFCVKWFTQFGWSEAGSGEADVLARATNTSIDALVRGGVFKAVAGKARLLGAEDLPDEWNPATDLRVSDWEVALRLAKALSEQGVERAAELMAGAGQRRDLDTVKELAYLLFSLSEKRNWTQTALLFNGLGTAWNDLEMAARSNGRRSSATQEPLLFDGEG